MALTAEALRQVGLELSPAAFEALILEALAEVAPLADRPAGPDELPPDEAAALTRGGFTRAPAERAETDPIARTAAAYAAILGASLTVAEAARRLGVDGSRVRQRLGERTLYGIRRRAGWRLPAFQFDGARPVPGLEVVLPRLDPDLHPVEVATWFTTPTDDLIVDDQAVSPRDWLRAGGPPAVVADIAAAL